MARESNKETFERKVKKSEPKAAVRRKKIPYATGKTKDVSTLKPPEKDTRENIEQLRTERDFLQDVISALSHPFYAIDANDHKILMANQAAINFFGDLSDNSVCYSWTHGRTDALHR